MSFSEKDRKVQPGDGKKFPSLMVDGSFAQCVAEALRTEFGSVPSALKTVAHLTRSNERAVRNWFEGKNGPNGENLVILMQHSDAVLKAVLGMARRQDLVVAVGLASLRRQLVDTVAAIDGLPPSQESP